MVPLTAAVGVFFLMFVPLGVAQYSRILPRGLTEDGGSASLSWCMGLLRVATRLMGTAEVLDRLLSGNETFIMNSSNGITDMLSGKC